MKSSDDESEEAGMEPEDGPKEPMEPRPAPMAQPAYSELGPPPIDETLEALVYRTFDAVGRTVRDPMGAMGPPIVPSLCRGREAYMQDG